MRVALVHDWLTGMRGGEYVLEAIAGLFRKPELFTLLYVPGTVSPEIVVMKRHASWFQRLPFAESRYRQFLPLMPLAVRSLNLKGFDLVVSSSHCVAKGVRKPPGSVHLSYVHAPMRYVWDRYEDYFGPGRSNLFARVAGRLIRPYLQDWDRSVSGTDRVDALVANSRFIASKIKEIYERDAEVIHPFANLSRFSHPRQPGKYYLIVSALNPYKRVDLAIRAFNRLKLPLLIVGGGPDAGRLKQLAGPTVELLGSLSNASIADLYAKCRALIFPGKEDFGITPLEAMAAGAPVIAFGAGGVIETVTEETGLFFSSQTEESLVDAVERFEKLRLDFKEGSCRARAQQFTREKFQKKLLLNIEKTWTNAGKSKEALIPAFSWEWAEQLRKQSSFEEPFHEPESRSPKPALGDASQSPPQ